MEDLIGFLRARLDEEETIARASEVGWLRVRPDDYEERVARSGWRSLPDARSSNTGMLPETLLHAAMHGPARVLAEVEAKRRMVEDLVAEKHHVCPDDWYTCPAATDERDGGTCSNETREGAGCDCGRDARVARRLRLLALPYASHESYPGRVDTVDSPIEG